MLSIAIFASGAGTNAKRIIAYFKDHPGIRVGLVVSNKPGAGVLEVAKNAGVPYIIIEKEAFFRGDAYVPELERRNIDFIVLAGFLWKIPQKLVAAFRGRMVNIHPALLPGYGGRGMYGQHVHEAVIASGDAESGISIHFVDELYDHGAVIFQAHCPVSASDTAETLAGKIHQLEYEHYPPVIEKILQQQNHR